MVDNPETIATAIRIGHPYGSTFKVTNGEMVKVNKSEVNEAFQCKNI
jgi:hypothetical protein